MPKHLITSILLSDFLAFVPPVSLNLETKIGTVWLPVCAIASHYSQNLETKILMGGDKEKSGNALACVLRLWAKHIRSKNPAIAIWQPCLLTKWCKKPHNVQLLIGDPQTTKIRDVCLRIPPGKHLQLSALICPLGGAKHM